MSRGSGTGNANRPQVAQRGADEENRGADEDWSGWEGVIEAEMRCEACLDCQWVRLVRGLKGRRGWGSRLRKVAGGSEDLSDGDTE